MKTLRELHHEALHAALTDAADKQLRPQAVDAAVRLAEIDMRALRDADSAATVDRRRAELLEAEQRHDPDNDACPLNDPETMRS